MSTHADFRKAATATRRNRNISRRQVMDIPTHSDENDEPDETRQCPECGHKTFEVIHGPRKTTYICLDDPIKSKVTHEETDYEEDVYCNKCCHQIDPQEHEELYECITQNLQDSP
jgi:hypothetical protein